MNFVSLNDLSIKAFRVIAAQKSTNEKEIFYKSIRFRITNEFAKLSMIELYHMIKKETDTYFLELECEILSTKLMTYNGPMTLEFLNNFFSLCSISDIWKLVIGANNSIIQLAAKNKLDEILKEYDNEEEIKSKQKEKRRLK